MKPKRLLSTYRWQQRRAQQLQEHPLCALCNRQGVTRAATVVHHVLQHGNNPEIFWSSPLQSLCDAHHNTDAQSREKGGNQRHVALGRDGCPIDW